MPRDAVSRTANVGNCWWPISSIVLRLIDQQKYSAALWRYAILGLFFLFFGHFWLFRYLWSFIVFFSMLQVFLGLLQVFFA